MTWLAAKLKHRVEVRKPVQTPNSDGGYDKTWIVLLTIWAGIVPISRGQPEYIRGKQIDETDTHIFTFRKVALEELVKAFGDGFSTSFNIISDLNNLKSEFYLFQQKPNTTKGRLWRVSRVTNVNEDDEFFEVFAEEIEELGTGYP